MQATVATIDVSDINQLAAAPGDLTIVNEEGDAQPLLSYGYYVSHTYYTLMMK